MIVDKPVPVKILTLVKFKLKDYSQLVKLRLTLLVVFSTVIGFLLASATGLEWSKLAALIIGGFGIVGASNTLNQIIERESDRLMSRTAERPLAEGRMNVQEAAWASVIMGMTGVVVMGLCLNALSAFISLAGLVLYAFAYTPLKKVTPLAVFVGGVSGAIPPLAGYVAVTNEVTVYAVILFLIQFFWQFPHFWAIAWVMQQEYQKAGIKLLPLGSNKDKQGAIQIMMLTVVLLPLSILPAKLGLISFTAAIICLACSIVFFMQAVKLYRDLSDRSALGLMFGSFLYLPVVLTVLLIDHWLF